MIELPMLSYKHRPEPFSYGVYEIDSKRGEIPGGGGTPLYGLYRYVPRNRVWFLEVLDP